MLLVQPITTHELMEFPEFFFQFFNSFSPMNYRKDFSFVVKNFDDYINPHFRPIFSNKEIYSGVLKEALDCGLVIRVPSKKNRRKNCFYFLNSDLLFRISYDEDFTGDNGINITENKEPSLRIHTHSIDDHTLKTTTSLKEQINFSIKKNERNNEKIIASMDILNHIFTLFWWSVKQPKLIKDTITEFRKYYNLTDIICSHKEKQTRTKPKNPNPLNIENPRILHFLNYPINEEKLPKEWKKNNRYLFKKAIQEEVLCHKNHGFILGDLFYYLMANEIYFSFIPSYSIFKCFNNYKNHVREIIKNEITPIGLLEILTSEDYQILPEKRSTIFTSILEYKEHIYSFKSEMGYLKNPSPNIARNTQLAGEIVLSRNGPFYPFLKTDEDRYKFHRIPYRSSIENG
jgi:hypothetical protein